MPADTASRNASRVNQKENLDTGSKVHANPERPMTPITINMEMNIRNSNQLIQFDLDSLAKFNPSCSRIKILGHLKQ